MPKTLSEMMQQAIRDSGLSLYALAKLSGVDSGQLTRFMAGERDFTLSTADRLCDVLGLELQRVAKASGAKRTPRHRKGEK